MKKQFRTKVRCWTTHIFLRIYKNHPPVSFKKSTEIIEEMHAAFIKHLFETSRPIQLKKSIGVLSLEKNKQRNKALAINWKKTRANHKIVRELNHHTNGYIWRVMFTMASRVSKNCLLFKPLKRHKQELTKRIYNKAIQ